MDLQATLRSNLLLVPSLHVCHIPLLPIPMKFPSILILPSQGTMQAMIHHEYSCYPGTPTGRFAISLYIHISLCAVNKRTDGTSCLSWSYEKNDITDFTHGLDGNEEEASSTWWSYLLLKNLRYHRLGLLIWCLRDLMKCQSIGCRSDFYGFLILSCLSPYRSLFSSLFALKLKWW